MENRKRRPTIAWGIKRNPNSILPFSIRHTRKEAIKNIEFYLKSEWKLLKKQGMATVKLEIKEVMKIEKVKRTIDPTQPFPQLELFIKTSNYEILQ